MRAPFQILAIPYKIVDGVSYYCVLHRADHDGWQFIAGGGENDETPLKAAKRETWEESGIQAENMIELTSLSSELGVPKADPQIFEKPLAMAGCTASQAVMIGDRLDNDIIPAKRFGMQTIWIRQGTAAYQSKELGDGYADYVIDNLSELKELSL